MTTPNPYSLDITTAMLIRFGFIEVPTSALLSLPREIRDNILAHLLRAGDLAILRTSRQLYKESRERLYREGIFRFKMGFHDSFSEGLLPDNWILFQSLHLHILVAYTDRGGEDDLPLFARLQLDGLRLLDHTYPEIIYPKRECRIVFDFGAVDPEPKRPLYTCNMKRALLMLAPLAAFTTVVFTFVPGQSELWEVEGTLRGKWEIIAEIMERSLGPSKVVRGTDKEEERMVFHPLEWINSLARTE